MRILQLTDLHLSADKNATLHGVNPWQTWLQVLADIKQRFTEQPFDLLVLSGDLSHDDSEASYQYIAETLAAFSGQVMYLPGNHDNYDVMQQVLIRSGFPGDRLVISDDWAVIGLNTQLPGKIYGQLAATELQWLENCLQQYADKKIILFTHHHTLKIRSFWLDQIRLKNAKALLKIIDAHQNVRAVVNGHVHQADQKRRGAVQYLATPATCSQVKAKTWRFKPDNLPPGYRVLQCHAELSSNVFFVAG